VGFTYTESNLISRGIAYVTRWTRMHQIKVSHALIVSNVTGQLLRRLLGKKVEELLCRLKDHPDRWICSELVAHCLDVQPEYHDTGVLLASAATIDPQELFEDDLLFTAWHR
jgi:hypothetical protein